LAFSVLLLAGVVNALADTTARQYRVTFHVTIPAAPADSKVFITGDREVLGQWNPAAIALEKQEDGSWARTFLLEDGRVEYKITRGSWETEAVNTDGTVPGNAVLNVASNETVNITVANWRDVLRKDVERKIEGQITGTIKYHSHMEADGILPRDVIVWLPPGYEKATEKRYPVLYAHDGQNAFDPTTSFLGVDWQIDETADRLIREKKLQ